MTMTRRRGKPKKTTKRKGKPEHEKQKKTGKSRKQKQLENKQDENDRCSRTRIFCTSGENLWYVQFCRRCSWCASTSKVCSSSVSTAYATQPCAPSGRAFCPESRPTRPTLRMPTGLAPLGIVSRCSLSTATSAIQGHLGKTLACNCLQLHETIIYISASENCN